MTKPKHALSALTEREAKMRALSASGLLGASLAHELRNTLAASESALFLARRDAQDKDRLASHLERAEASIRRSQEVVDRVLSLARGEPLRTEVAELGPIFASVVEELASSPIAVSTSVSPPDLSVACDPILLERLLSNLVSNACEALAARGSGQIVLRAYRDEDALCVEVEDDGPGVAPALLPQLFEPLVTDKPQGTGLGLAFCRTIALVHGGTIEASKGTLAGALFRLSLPARSRSR